MTVLPGYVRITFAKCQARIARVVCTPALLSEKSARVAVAMLVLAFFLVDALADRDSLG